MATRPSYITRFRTKTPDKVWGAKGPDLLRSRANAGVKLGSAIHDKSGLYVKLGALKPWRRVGSPAKVLELFDKTDVRDFTVGAPRDGKTKAIYQVRRERVPYKVLSNCSPATSRAWSLTSFAFPNSRFAGGYVWKQVSGSASWSDHAWGTAFDITSGANNDAVTDWLARMAKEGLIDFDYALGSRDNETKVVQVSGGGSVSPSSASDSHLWHVHVSVVDHDGRKPPRQGGVW